MSAPALLELVASTIGVDLDEVSETASMETHSQWDSLRQVLLMTELERQFGIKFSYKEMTEAVSVPQIRALLAARNVAAA